jgi:hypothetical protein
LVQPGDCRFKAQWVSFTPGTKNHISARDTEVDRWPLCSEGSGIKERRGKAVAVQCGLKQAQVVQEAGEEWEAKAGEEGGQARMHLNVSSWLVGNGTRYQVLRDWREAV